MIVIGIVIGLQTVGVVLMSAMLIAPAAAARQWTNRLEIMTILAAFFGAVAGISGALISSVAEKLPTGPMIVLVISAITLFSLFFAPCEGWYGIESGRSTIAGNSNFRQCSKISTFFPHNTRKLTTHIPSRCCVP